MMRSQNGQALDVATPTSSSRRQLGYGREMRPSAEVIAALLDGPMHSFADPIAPEVPARGAGIYTVWDEDGKPVYVGVAGRNPDGAGLAGRLKSHSSGRRNGDQFCVYVADHYVLPELTSAQVQEIAAARLSMDALVREKVQRSFCFRTAVTADYATALAAEKWIKSGAADCGPPRLNPL
jgi:hypothetical protein